MSILSPHLDPFAAGDFDERCYRCERANLDNPATPADEPCPIERYGRTPCAACCVRLWQEGDEVGAYCVDCHDAINVPTRNPVGAEATPSNHASASSDPASAPTITYAIEACDSCNRAYSTSVLTPVTDTDGLSELRCPGCVERLREELRDLGLSA